MARTHTIWLVMSNAFGPLKAFTVKHELITWLSKKPAHMKMFWSIWSLPDGATEERKPQWLMRADKW